MPAAKSVTTYSVSGAEANRCAQAVCAVMVTYHPSAAMVENLRDLAAQVQGLVIVDNGSNAGELHALRAVSQDLALHLIENGTNLGVAEALNRGVRRAKDLGYRWVILFDQDSRTEPAFIERMFKAWQTHPKREALASIHPRYMHPGLGGFGRYGPRAPDGSPVWSMTSGALMPTWIFDRIGWFASEFFIDWIDIEYCFRIRSAGYLIAESRAILMHDP